MSLRYSYQKTFCYLAVIIVTSHLLHPGFVSVCRSVHFELLHLFGPTFMTSNATE